MGTLDSLNLCHIYETLKIILRKWINDFWEKSRFLSRKFQATCSVGGQRYYTLNLLGEFVPSSLLTWSFAIRLQSLSFSGKSFTSGANLRQAMSAFFI